MSIIVVSGSGGSQTAYVPISINTEPPAVIECAEVFTGELVDRLAPFDACMQTSRLLRK